MADLAFRTNQLEILLFEVTLLSISLLAIIFQSTLQNLRTELCTP